MIYHLFLHVFPSQTQTFLILSSICCFFEVGLIHMVSSILLLPMHLELLLVHFARSAPMTCKIADLSVFTVSGALEGWMSWTQISQKIRKSKSWQIIQWNWWKNVTVAVTIIWAFEVLMASYSAKSWWQNCQMDMDNLTFYRYPNREKVRSSSVAERAFKNWLALHFVTFLGFSRWLL